MTHYGIARIDAIHYCLLMNLSMKAKPLFDTLNYAKLLEKGGVEKADVHAASLAHTLAQNFYIKDEVDVRLERAIHHFEKTLDQRFNELQMSQHALELRVEKTMNRYLITSITILGSLIVLVGAVSTFAHALFH